MPDNNLPTFHTERIFRCNSISQQLPLWVSGSVSGWEGEWVVDSFRFPIFISRCCWCVDQTSLICGVIDDRSRSFKAINKRVFTNFRHKNAVSTNFQAKNTVFTNFRVKIAVFTNLRDKNIIITYFFAKMFHIKNA